MKHLKRINESKDIPISGIKMSNIFKKQVVYSVDSGDLAGLISELYGKDPEIEASLELGHDDTFEISADSREFEKREFDKWIRKRSYSHSEIYMLMNKLAYDGHIENGDYLIKVC